MQKRIAINLKEYLQDILPPDELELLVRSYDVVGDMAIIIIAPELEHRERLIGEALLANRKDLKVVAKRDGLYSGEFRTLPLKVIAGENRKETIHKEYGVNLLVNPEAVYFSVRSGTERKRIADLVNPGERVLVLFSGIAPYPLIIAANSEASEIVGIEKNPVAHEYGLKNVSVNKKMKNVVLHYGDVVEILPTLGYDFDRIVMPLPKGGELFLDQAINALRSDGVLHFYDMQHVDMFGESVEKLRMACTSSGRQLYSAEIVKCGHCAPRIYRLCIDAVIS